MIIKITYRWSNVRKKSQIRQWFAVVTFSSVCGRCSSSSWPMGIDTDTGHMLAVNQLEMVRAQSMSFRTDYNALGPTPSWIILPSGWPMHCIILFTFMVEFDKVFGWKPGFENLLLGHIGQIWLLPCVFVYFCLSALFCSQNFRVLNWILFDIRMNIFFVKVCNLTKSKTIVQYLALKKYPSK